MKIKHNGHTIELYDSIQDLPITRFMAYNLNLMIDSGIGADMNDFSQHITSTIQLIDRDPEEAKKRLMNLYQNVQFIISNTSPKMNSFVVMIKKINGHPALGDDLSQDEIKSIIEELGEKKIPFSTISKFLKDVKKKIDQDFEVFFPEKVTNPEIIEYYNYLKRRISLVLQKIYKKLNTEEQIKEIDEFLFSRIKTRTFHGEKGEEALLIKGFENTCVILSQHNVSSEPKKMTTLAYYQALEVIKQMLKNRKNK